MGDNIELISFGFFPFPRLFESTVKSILLVSFFERGEFLIVVTLP